MAAPWRCEPSYLQELIEVLLGRYKAWRDRQFTLHHFLVLLYQLPFESRFLILINVS